MNFLYSIIDFPKNLICSKDILGEKFNVCIGNQKGFLEFPSLPDWEKNNNDPLPTMVPAKSIVLTHKILISGTHAFTITTQKPKINDGSMTYIFDGKFVTSAGIETAYKEIKVNLLTIDPLEKDFTFEIGTGNLGILSIKKYMVCDQ